MVELRNNWCISRQRQWGVPIPVFYDVDTGKEIISEESIAHIKDCIRKHPRGTDCWWELSITDLLPLSLRSHASKEFIILLFFTII